MAFPSSPEYRMTAMLRALEADIATLALDPIVNATIAVGSVRAAVAAPVEEVVFCCFSRSDLAVYLGLLA